MANHVTQAPIMRFFKLSTDEQHAAEFLAIGRNNLSTSIKTEAGTLAMYATHLTDSPLVNYVVEIYRDEEAYQAHIDGNHFKTFAQFAQTALTGREVYQTNPVLLLEKAMPIYIESGSSLAIKLARVEVKADNNEAFADIVTNEMKAAIELEEGVLVMYASTSAEQPNLWYFFEIYADEAAYQSHRQTSHFKDYIEKTAYMVTDKQLTALSGDTLVNQGSLCFDKRN